jgi:hypothetical protein
MKKNKYRLFSLIGGIPRFKMTLIMMKMGHEYKRGTGKGGESVGRSRGNREGTGRGKGRDLKYITCICMKTEE